MRDVAQADSLITRRQAAEMLSVSERTVERLQADGELVPVYLPTTGRAKLRRFRRADIEARIAAAQQVSA